MKLKPLRNPETAALKPLRNASPPQRNVAGVAKVLRSPLWLAKLEKMRNAGVTIGFVGGLQ
ncbi:hypothetical protein [Novipirellula sp.]|uniref:hypothetical protein n=1 Tax=Novipirellula sp. TaxID=2795430 RepID=UPI00356AB603